MHYVENNVDRKQHLQCWIEEQLKRAPLPLEVASADASFRRYFRVNCDGRTLIAMDAPPAHEDCRPFVKVAGLMAEAGLNVPEVVATDFERGFIRAEVIAFDDYITLKGEQGAKESGKLRLEGKEYVVKEGDVMHFRFNV